MALRMADLLAPARLPREGPCSFMQCATTSLASSSGRPRRGPSGCSSGRMGGVLFIDEAYYLYRASDSRTTARRPIEIRLQVMENDSRRISSSSWPVTRTGWMTFYLQSGYELADHPSPGLRPLRSRRPGEIGRCECSTGRAISYPQRRRRRSGRTSARRWRSLISPMHAACATSWTGPDLRHAYRLAAQPHRGWSREDRMRRRARGHA